MTRVIAKEFLADTVGLNSPAHPGLDQVGSTKSVLDQNRDFLEERLESFSLSVRGKRVHVAVESEGLDRITR